MSFKLGYCALRWREPDLEAALTELKKIGWDGWECRLPLDWLGTPKHVKQICDNVGMPMAVYSAAGTPDSRDYANVERNKRRMEFAAEMGADCFLYMNGRKPEGRTVTDADVIAAAEGADAWAEYAAQLGLELTYHIHTNLLVDNIAHWRLYMQHLDKAKLCIDVSHAELWGYDPVASLRDFASQLNYVHLQDYASCTVRKEGEYNPEWVAVGQAECLDFGGVRDVLHDIDYNRWVTGCPGAPPPGDDAVSEAKRSKAMFEYMKRMGF